MTKSYALDCLIRAMEKQDGRAAAVIVGKGNQEAELKALAGENLGKKVFFLPPVPKATVPTLAEAADACYVGALKNDMFRFGICMNKMFDSMMSGRPVLFAVEAPNNPIAEYGCGVTVRAEDPDALAEGIHALEEMPPEERKRLGDNGRKAVLAHFTYEKLAAEFLEAAGGSGQ